MIYRPTFPEVLAVSRSCGRLSQNQGAWNDKVLHVTGIQGGGKEWKDVSGYDNHGTLTNGPTWEMTEKGWAVDFVAVSNTYIALTPFVLTGTLSISVWLRPDAAGGSGTFLGGTSSNFIRFSGINLLTFRANGITTIITLDDDLVLGDWYHVVITRSTAGVLVVSLNGQAQADTDTNTEPLTVGFIGAKTATANWFDGAISSLAIHEHDIASSEIWDQFADPDKMLRLRARVPISTTIAPSVGMLNRFGSMKGGISGGRYSIPMTGGMRG